MDELRATIARAIDGDGMVTTGLDGTYGEQRADAVLAVIGRTHVLVERDTLSHWRDVLQAAGKPRTARAIDDLLARAAEGEG